MCTCVLAAQSIAQEGTASLVGKVEDIRGVGLLGTLADLHSESLPTTRSRVVADNLGMFRFSILLDGKYTLELQQAGFRRLTVKGISVSEGEHKVLPTLRMEVSSLDCSSHTALDHLRLGKPQGSLTSSVRVLHGHDTRNSRPMGGGEVTLICSKSTVCGAAKPNSKGEFLFQNLAPGNYALRANHVGFYPVEESGYEVQEGLESIYFPMYLKRCPLGNCDPRLGPKKPLAHCE